MKLSGCRDEADVHRADDLVEVGVEAVAQEQRLASRRQLLHLPPIEADPAFHAVDWLHSIRG